MSEEEIDIQANLEANKYKDDEDENSCFIEQTAFNSFKSGVGFAQSKMYSEKELKQFAFECVGKFLSNDENKLEMKLVDVIIDRIEKHFETIKNK